MKKLRIAHIEAVTRSQNLLETAVNVEGNESLRKSIANDVYLLSDLRLLLYYALENPALPFLHESEDPL